MCLAFINIDTNFYAFDAQSNWGVPTPHDDTPQRLPRAVSLPRR